MKKSEIVYSYIENKVTYEYLIENLKNLGCIGISAYDVQEDLNIVRNNASTLLNDLVKSDKLIKINSRPVTYIPKSILIDLGISEVNKKNTFSLEEFKEISSFLDNESKTEDPFKYLIGYNNSLSHQIEQAKAAIMYPPHGLHTLILGESGVGKTTFASAIYEYAKLQKNLESSKFPFIAFNCSDYYNTPQLLLSQLFGHVKGAFTGAESDKAGLVEKANNGILFLDEIHRLPPDGQEMLFYLMDKGEYSRLGETSSPRKSNVLIICATTENPSDTFLSTFLRRIPVIINLPSFREKSASEKFEVIENLFYYEALKLNMPIKISPEALKALTVYDFQGGNIGQLSSEIKLVCAKAFFQHLQDEDELNVDFKMLNKEIKEYIFGNNHITAPVKSFLNMFTQDIIIYPTVSLHKKSYLDDLNKDSEDIYDSINKKLDELKNRGLDKETIASEINTELENHFNSVMDRFNPNDVNIRNLYNFIPKEIVDTSSDLVNIAQEKLGTKLDNKFFFGFTFHVHSLLKRLQENKPIKNPNMPIIKRQYPLEFKVSSELVKILSEKFGVLIPEDEKGFISILLANAKIENADTPHTGIILVCHGTSTASSMAEVANKLLNVDFVKAIDMSIDSKISETYENVRAAVLAVNRGYGVLLLVDMGSLTDFGQKIMNETGIKIKTIKNVSTLLVLNALRTVLYKENTLDDLYSSLVNSETEETAKVTARKNAILTVCVTGQGAGLIAKDILKDLLKDSFSDSIEIITANYQDIENNLANITEKYNILACVGSLKPNIDVPYFPINKLLSSGFKSKFIQFLNSKLDSHSSSEINSSEPVKSAYELSKEMLEQYVKYVNPKIAVINIKKFIEKLGLLYEDEKQENLIDLIVHTGCMLDRCIHGDFIKFDNMYAFINSNTKDFEQIKEASKLLEKEFDIHISDDEICYLIKVINK